MKFTPVHRPIALSGITAIAGVATFALLFLITSSALHVPAPSQDVAMHPVHRDTVAGPARSQAVAAPTTTDVPASVLSVPGLTESVRGSLLAAAEALKARHGSPPTRPARETMSPPPADRRDPAGHPVVHQGSPRRSEGTVTFGSLQWIGGGKRKKASGAMPAWPAGVAGEVHCKVEAVVAPDGRVRSVRPGQKGNAKCEDAAVRAVHQWRFEKLARHIPQRDQRCVVTFTFTAK